jgi:hypothetical protein
MRQLAFLTSTDEGMVTGFLITSNMFLQSGKCRIYLEKTCEKLWKATSIRCFDTGELREHRMKTSRTTTPFRKTAACPASATLLSFRCQNLPAETAGQVQEHLGTCDFCCAEVRLLAHYEVGNTAFKVPEIPINLRILAEAILSRR